MAAVRAAEAAESMRPQPREGRVEAGPGHHDASEGAGRGVVHAPVERFLVLALDAHGPSPASRGQGYGRSNLTF